MVPTDHRAVACMMRLLHWHFRLAGPGIQPLVWCDDFHRKDKDLGGAQKRFSSAVSKACEILRRGMTFDASQANVFFCFFPVMDDGHRDILDSQLRERMRAKGVKRSANRSLPFVFILAGDNSFLDYPGSAKEEEERGLDILRVEWGLRKLTCSRDSDEGDKYAWSQPIVVEYERGGEDAAKDRLSTCRLRPQQRKLLIGGQDILLLSEKWLLYGPGDFFAPYRSPGTTSKPRDNSLSSEKIAKFRGELLEWLDRVVSRWELADGKKYDRMVRKYGTQEAYINWVHEAAAKRFHDRTGLALVFDNV